MKHSELNFYNKMHSRFKRKVQFVNQNNMQSVSILSLKQADRTYMNTPRCALSKWPNTRELSGHVQITVGINDDYIQRENNNVRSPTSDLRTPIDHVISSSIVPAKHITTSFTRMSANHIYYILH